MRFFGKKAVALLDRINAETYVGHEKNWMNDLSEHSRQQSQLTYVEKGWQYFHIGSRIYLVPQHHIIWIPSGMAHRINRDAELVSLMLVLFKTVPKESFYDSAHVFQAPPVLKEMR